MQIQLKKARKKPKEPIITQKVRPEHLSTARCILLADRLGAFGKVHAATLLVLYLIGAILCLISGDFEFVITSKSASIIFGSILCTQAILGFHLLNIGILIGASLKFLLERKGCKSQVYFSQSLKKGSNLLLSCAICSLGVFSMVVCYVDHADYSTLGICPVAVFILFSHLSSLLFKYEFIKKSKELRIAVKNPEEYENKAVLSKGV